MRRNYDYCDKWVCRWDINYLLEYFKCSNAWGMKNEDKTDRKDPTNEGCYMIYFEKMVFEIYEWEFPARKP